MAVADDPPHTMKPTGLEAGEELPPGDLGLRERDAHPEDRAAAFGVDADGHEHRTREDRAAVADLLGAGIPDQVRHLAEGRFRPVSNSASRAAAARLTWALRTSKPQSCSVMAATLRVETP
jgi:hypothetical protein